MNVLFTGFKGYNNPSNVIIEKISNEIGSDTLLFTNSYEQIDKQLEKINLDGYDFIIMLGLRNNLKKSIRLEVNAFKDNCLLTTNINYEKVCNYFIDNGVNCFLKSTPTNYLCNYAYYKVLRKNKNAIFIHLPKLNNIDNLTKIISNIKITIT